LRELSAIVVTEAQFGEGESFWKHPAFAVVLGEKPRDTGVTVTTRGFDVIFEITEGREGQDRMPELWIFVLVNTPKPLWIKT
jgi:hypothetical protein